jgi:hypothetical protein
LKLHFAAKFRLIIQTKHLIFKGIKRKYKLVIIFFDKPL